MPLSDSLKHSIRRLVDVLEDNEVMSVEDFLDCAFYWLGITRHKEALELFRGVATKGYREKQHKVDIVCTFLTELSEMTNYHIKTFFKKGDFHDQPLTSQIKKPDSPRRATVSTNA